MSDKARKRTPGGGSPSVPDAWYNLEQTDLSTMSERKLTELREYLMELHSEAREDRRSRDDTMPHYITEEDELMREILDVVRMVDDEMFERDMKAKDEVFDSHDIESLVMEEISDFVQSGSVSEEEAIEALERVKRQVRQEAPEAYYRSEQSNSSRVYVESRQEVPQGRQARTDEKGSVFYTLSQEPKKASNSVAQSFREEYPEELPVPDDSDVEKAPIHLVSRRFDVGDELTIDTVDGIVQGSLQEVKERSVVVRDLLRGDIITVPERDIVDVDAGIESFEETELVAAAEKSSFSENQERWLRGVVDSVADRHYQRDIREIVTDERPSTWKEVAETLIRMYTYADNSTFPEDVLEEASQRVMDEVLTRYSSVGGPMDWYRENVMSESPEQERGYPYSSEYRPQRIEGRPSMRRSKAEYGADARLAELGFQPSHRGAGMAQCLECGEHVPRTQLDIHMRECPQRSKEDDDVDPDEIEDPDDDGEEEFDIEGDPDEIEDPDDDGEEEMDVDPSEDDEKGKFLCPNCGEMTYAGESLGERYCPVCGETVRQKESVSCRDVLQGLDEDWEDKDDPCWDGYEMIGTKVVDGDEVPNCVPKSDSKSVEKQEPREGLEWSEKVEIVNVDEEENEVTLEDQLTGTEWTETVDDIEAKLEALNERDHGWLYDMIEGQYPEIDASTAHEVLHEFDRLADDPSEEVLENMARMSKIAEQSRDGLADVYNLERSSGCPECGSDLMKKGECQVCGCKKVSKAGRTVTVDNSDVEPLLELLGSAALEASGGDRASIRRARKEISGKRSRDKIQLDGEAAEGLKTALEYLRDAMQREDDVPVFREMQVQVLEDTLERSSRSSASKSPPQR